MIRRTCAATAAVLALAAAAFPGSDRAPLAALVPAEMPLFLELRGGDRLLDAALGSALYRELKELPEWQAKLAAPDARQLLTGLKLFAGALGGSLEQAARDLLAGEIAVALRLTGDGQGKALLLVRRSSPAEAARLAEAVDAFVTLIASGDEPAAAGPVRSANGKEFRAVRGDCFLWSNERTLVEESLLRAEQGAAAPTWLADHAPEAGHLAVRGDLAALLALAGAPDQPPRHDDALAPLLFQGLLLAVLHGEIVDLDLAVAGAALELRARVTGGLGAARSAAPWYFPEGEPPLDLADPQGTIAALELERDFSAFYAALPDLLAEDLEGKRVEFDSVAALFLGGHSFGAEFLPGLGRRARLLAAAQSYAGAETRPDVQIPGFALVAPRAGGALGKSDLLMAFQTAIGLVNIDRAQKGMSSLLLGSESRGGAELAAARFVAEDSEDARAMRFNATPALAVGDRTLVLGSAREQVADIADAISAGAAADSRPPANLALAIDFGLVKDLARANRETLVTNRMVDEGATRAEAESFFELLDRVLGALGRGSLRIAAEGDDLVLEAAVEAARELAK